MESRVRGGRGFELIKHTLKPLIRPGRHQRGERIYGHPAAFAVVQEREHGAAERRSIERSLYTEM